MFDGDEYGDQLLGDPSNLDDLIEARDLNPLEDEQNAGEDEGDGQDEDNGEDSKDKDKTKRRIVRNPLPKLDAIRLTGPRGIATVEGLFKDFKFLGHGNEEQDLRRIMERLELWGNRLFPKYQFDDLLEKIEKLGQKRPVINFVNRIRMGLVTEDSVAEAPGDMIEDVEMDLDADLSQGIERKADANDDLFTQLIEQQLSQVESQQHQYKPPAPQTEITEEQRHRMLQNRRLAEERRLARLKAQQEKDSVPSTSGELSQVEPPSQKTETEDVLQSISQTDKAEGTSENADGNVDINDAAVSTIEEKNVVDMEISTMPGEEGD